MKATRPENFLDFLEAGAKKMGLCFSGESLRRCQIHQNLLSKWADKTNLTTVRDPKGMAERLYLDSAVLAPHLSPGARLHDVGTGPGFPGLVLKAMDPSLEVTLTEARRKKVTFLKLAAREMEIEKGLEIVWERLLPPFSAPGKRTWPEVVSRAAFPLPEWLEVGKQLVSPGGRIWILAGSPHEENQLNLGAFWQQLPKTLVIEQHIQYQLPFCGVRRSLVSLRDVSNPSAS